MTIQVFISHDHEDKAAYTSLCVALEQSGVLRWDTSQLPIGNSLAEGLRTAINQCDICIFLATTRSLESKWCLAELGAFWGAGKKVIVYLTDPDIEEARLPPQFSGDLRTSDAWELIRAIKSNNTDIGRVKKIKNGYSTLLDEMAVNVVFGKIEEFDYSDEECLVALPANEFFDDDCINDSKSALGAFMKFNFNENIPEIQELVRDTLKDEPKKKVLKEQGKYSYSYGVGKCIYLDRPISKNLRIAMVSVTTQRMNQGLLAEAEYIFSAAKALHSLISNKRSLKRLYLPILGSGHGDLKGEISLICM